MAKNVGGRGKGVRLILGKIRYCMTCNVKYKFLLALLVEFVSLLSGYGLQRLVDYFVGTTSYAIMSTNTTSYLTISSCMLNL